MAEVDLDERRTDRQKGGTNDARRTANEKERMCFEQARTNKRATGKRTNCWPVKGKIVSKSLSQKLSRKNYFYASPCLSLFIRSSRISCYVSFFFMLLLCVVRTPLP